MCIAEGDVYLDVERGDVLHFAHFGDFLLDFIGQGDGGEDGERAILEAHDCAATADFYATKARKGDGEGGDGARDDVADDHYLCGV